MWPNYLAIANTDLFRQAPTMLIKHLMTVLMRIHCRPIIIIISVGTAINDKYYFISKEKTL